MITPVPRDARAPLEPLFEGFPGLRGVLHAVLEGAMGEAWADNPKDPNVARIKLDFEAIAGDPSHPAAPEAIRSLKQGDHLVVPEPWADVLIDTWQPLQPYERTEFSPGAWDLAELRARQTLPDGLSLVRIDATNVAAFARLDPAFVYNFDSHEDYLARGIGFGVATGPEFIAGCSSYAISSRSLEFEIETAEAYQRRGLAIVTGSRMIQHCLETGLEPCWDAAHEGSARLALKLGFVHPRPYTAYRLE
jgi:GNAT superfamily N-acetyltransferase